MKRSEGLTEAIRRYESSIQVVVDFKLEGLNPMTLTEQGRIDDAQKLAIAIDQITENKLGSVVEKRVADAKKTPSKVARKPEQPSFQPRTYQMSLEEAHPEGVSAFYRWEEPTSPSTPYERDPEKKIGFMHRIFQSKNSRARDKFRSWEMRKEWQQLARWLGLPTEEEKKDILRAKMETVIAIMKDVMPQLWETIEQGQNYSIDDLNEFERRAKDDPRYWMVKKRKR